jgi:tripartite-type tricarboxylate transporter receptor subunit TctC
VLALILMASNPAGAWPDQPLRLVVPFAAGGTTDVMARVIAERLSPHLGQPVVIENVPGSGGNTGAALVATPNGSTILMATPGPAAMNQFMYNRMPFDTSTAFAPIVYIASVPSVLVVSPKLNVKSVTDFISQMKARPEGANFGSAGMGSLATLAGRHRLHRFSRRHRIAADACSAGPDSSFLTSTVFIFAPTR